jgi:hypothetical protein
MKVLVICQPRPGVTPAEMIPHLPAETAALPQLRAAGQLDEAFSPGSPGAGLILDCPNTDAARRITETLPLYRAGLVDTEVIELHPSTCDENAMTEKNGAGRGALAQILATRGGRAATEAPFVIEHREALI